MLLWILLLKNCIEYIVLDISWDTQYHPLTIKICQLCQFFAKWNSFYRSHTIIFKKKTLSFDTKVFGKNVCQSFFDNFELQRMAKFFLIKWKYNVCQSFFHNFKQKHVCQNFFILSKNLVYRNFFYKRKKQRMPKQCYQKKLWHTLFFHFIKKPLAYVVARSYQNSFGIRWFLILFKKIWHTMLLFYKRLNTHEENRAQSRAATAKLF